MVFSPEVERPYRRREFRGVASTGEEVVQLKGHTGCIYCVAWHPTSSDLLCTESVDDIVRVGPVHLAEMQLQGLQSENKQLRTESSQVQASIAQLQAENTELRCTSAKQILALQQELADVRAQLEQQHR